MGTRNFTAPKNASANYTIDYKYDNFTEDDYEAMGDNYYREIERSILDLFVEKLREKYKKIWAKKFDGGRQYDWEYHFFQHGKIDIRTRIEYGYYDWAYIDFDIYYDGFEVEWDDNKDKWGYIDDCYSGDYYLINCKESIKIERLMKYANEILFDITNPIVCVGSFSNWEGIYKSLK